MNYDPPHPGTFYSEHAAREQGMLPDNDPDTVICITLLSFGLRQDRR
jgi:hypothetical protein